MRTIEIRITEDAILNNTGYTIEQLAESNGYQSIINNPDYVQGRGTPTIMADWVEKPDPYYVEEVWTPTIENPLTCVEYLAKQGLETMVRTLASPLLSQVTHEAQNQAQQAFNQALEAVIAKSEIKVTN